jgi:hypothetical protein
MNMGFRFGYLLPSLFLVIWWLYSIFRANNESGAYLFLFAIVSLPIPLVFLLLDDTINRSPIMQLALDICVFIGFTLIVKTLYDGFEWWEFLGLVLLYSTNIYIFAIDRLFGLFGRQ